MNKKLLSYFSALIILSVTPLTAVAQVTDFKSFVKGIVELGNFTVTAIVAVSVIIIIFGVFRYFIASGDKERLKKGKDVIVYGILGIIVIYSIVAVVSLLLNSLKFDTAQPEIPQWEP